MGDSAKADADAKEPVGKKAKARATLEELTAYVQSLGLPVSDAEYLFDHWSSTGWKNGKNDIKDWQATVRNWKRCNYLPSLQADKRNGKFSRPAEKPDNRRYVPVETSMDFSNWRKGVRE